MLVALLACTSEPPAPGRPTAVTPTTSTATGGSTVPTPPPCTGGCCYSENWCPPVIIASIDVDGQTVSPGASVTATFGFYDCSFESGEITVDGVPGSVVTDRWDSMTFVPDAPFPAAATLHATASAELFCYSLNCGWGCDGSLDATFQTLGPMDLALVTGRTYVLAWDEVTVSEPSDDDAFHALAPIGDLLLQTRSADGTSEHVSTVFATGDGLPVTPDCRTALARNADVSANPFLVYTGDVETAWDGGDPVLLQGFSWTGTLSVDGSALSDVHVRALMAPEALGTSDCPELAASLGGTCAACQSSATGQCLQVEGDAAAAPSDPVVDPASACGL